VPRQIRENRKDLLQYVNRDELESLDQSVELFALLFGGILGILTYFSSVLQLSSFTIIAQSFNFIATLSIWTAYKIARTKISIDLRFWVIVEGITLSYFIIMQLVFVIPSIFPSIDQSIVFGGSFLAYMILIFGTDKVRPFARRIVEKRWERMKENEIEDNIRERIDREALYLVQGGRLDTMVYTFLAMVLVLLATLGMNPSRFPFIILLSFDIIGFTVIYLIWKVNRLQNRVWPNDE